MNKRNVTPLMLSALLIVLISIFSAVRLNNQSIWAGSILNLDMAFPVVYVIWILLEWKVSQEELSKGHRTSDYGTCEVYAIGQAGVFISALWFNPFWKQPKVWHFLGFLMFVTGIAFRLWAIRTLGRYYSHIVREVHEHKVVQSGPYRYMRHPAYAGMILANSGIVLFFFNLSTLAIFFLVLLPVIVLRIFIEERTLFRINGYSEFARSRKRLIPAVW